MIKNFNTEEVWFCGREYRVLFRMLDFGDIRIEKIISAMGFEVELEDYPVFEAALELVIDDEDWEVAS